MRSSLFDNSAVALLDSDRMAEWMEDVRSDPHIDIDSDVLLAAIAGAKDDMEGIG